MVVGSSPTWVGGGGGGVVEECSSLTHSNFYIETYLHTYLMFLSSSAFSLVAILRLGVEAW